LFNDDKLAGELEALVGTLRAAKKRGVIDFEVLIAIIIVIVIVIISINIIDILCF
jgi:t-SNARE complex subunit (syntaxin)